MSGGGLTCSNVAKCHHGGYRPDGKAAEHNRLQIIIQSRTYSQYFQYTEYRMFDIANVSGAITRDFWAHGAYRGTKACFTTVIRTCRGLKGLGPSHLRWILTLWTSFLSGAVACTCSRYYLYLVHTSSQEILPQLLVFNIVDA